MATGGQLSICVCIAYMKFKKSSPLKLQGQSKPNFTKMILGWSLSKVCPMTPTSDQYGRQAKNRKKRDEFQKSSPLKLLFKF